MAKTREYILVLWGKYFEEATTTIFVTELRQSGLRVKVVGLDGSQTCGMHGLTIVPDMPLSKALSITDKVLCVIVPCSRQRWSQLYEDPRVNDFFEQAFSNHASVVVNGAAKDVFNNNANSFFSVPDQSVVDEQMVERVPTHKDVLVYPESDDLLEFARGLAHDLHVRDHITK